MRLPNSAHETHPWRIRDVAADFEVEDVWALPVYGGAEDFPILLEVMGSLDSADSQSLATRALFSIRQRLGDWFGWDHPANGLAIPGNSEISLAHRLPDDLRGTAAQVNFGSLPFEPLYQTDTEFAAEISNDTVHGVMHLAWVDQGDGRYQGQMAVYVRPRGRLGRTYMGLIKPFRHWIVYPALMRQIEKAWNAQIAR